MSYVINNALLVPYRVETGLILVQDRRGHRPPPWGFFGGGVEPGETPLQAVLREAREELGPKLAEDTLRYDGKLVGRHRDLSFTLHPFLWAFSGDLSELTLGEGAGMEFVTTSEMLKRTEAGGPDNRLAHRLQTLLGG